MDEIAVDNDGITIGATVANLDQAGRPPLVFVHGWPELSHSWRHQMEHFAAAGWPCVAIDVRGYGRSSAPPEIPQYTLKKLAGDVAAVIEEVGDRPAIVIGHDWGAPIVYHTAIRHPDMVGAVAGMSVPHTPPLPISLLDVFDQLYADRFFYMLYFQEPGVVEAAFDRDLRDALKRVYFALCGDGPESPLSSDVGRDVGLLDLLPPAPDGPLPFMSDDDLDRYVEAFARVGMVGAFNRYRALAVDPQDSADVVGAHIAQPSIFVGGARDSVRSMVPGSDAFADPGSGCADFRGATIVEGAGHWVQQEAPAEVNAALDAFFDDL
ncbi:MAG: alpha/beta hydrolase [Ilumatobacteraceae bacterium]|nr:alpha/beta hydrolase [Ilumatobacteraceae bacterium]